MTGTRGSVAYWRAPQAKSTTSGPPSLVRRCCQLLLPGLCRRHSSSDNESFIPRRRSAPAADGPAEDHRWARGQRHHQRHVVDRGADAADGAPVHGARVVDAAPGARHWRGAENRKKRAREQLFSGSCDAVGRSRNFSRPHPARVTFFTFRSLLHRPQSCLCTSSIAGNPGCEVQHGSRGHGCVGAAPLHAMADNAWPVSY